MSDETTIDEKRNTKLFDSAVAAVVAGVFWSKLADTLRNVQMPALADPADWQADPAIPRLPFDVDEIRRVLVGAEIAARVLQAAYGREADRLLAKLAAYEAALAASEGLAEFGAE